MSTKQKKFLILMVLSTAFSMALHAGFGDLETTLTFGTQTGYTTLLAGEDKRVSYMEPLYVEIGLSLPVQVTNGISAVIYGNYRNEMSMVSVTSFSPSQDYYKVGVSMTVSHVTAGIEHECWHPIVPFGKAKDVSLDGGYTRMYVRFSNVKK